MACNGCLPRRRVLLCAGALAFAVSGAASASTPIPAESDWTDYGMVVDAGPFGEAWDAILEGITPCAVIEKNGTYFLYYVGSDDYIDDDDNIGPAHRSIGVATGTDGIHWTKYAGNPVITFTSSGNPEEGAVSGGVFLDTNGDFVAYFGANISSSPTSASVQADCRLAESSNGFDFTPSGIVVAHNDNQVWGYGDELHSVGAFRSNGTWYCYYIPNGSSKAGKLGVAWGPARDNLPNNSAVLDGAAEIRARGPMSIALVDANTAAFFVSYKTWMDVRTTTLDALDQASAPVTYGFGRAVVMLDSARRTWFMYYGMWGGTGLRLAPAGAADATAPGAPPNLSAAAAGHDRIDLAWNAASDPDTGVLMYNIYRGGVKVGSTRELSFSDTGLSELTGYGYEVRAVNLHGTEGPGSTANAKTPADVTPPGIESVSAGGDPNAVTVVFNEPVDQTTAETAEKYAIDKGIAVTGAALAGDLRTVTLRDRKAIT